MKLSIFAILAVLAVSTTATEDSWDAEMDKFEDISIDINDIVDPVERELRSSACKRWDKKCCNCVDDCDSSDSDSGDLKKCYRKDCKRKCKRAAGKCKNYDRNEYLKYARRECHAEAW